MQKWCFVEYPIWYHFSPSCRMVTISSKLAHTPFLVRSLVRYQCGFMVKIQSFYLQYYYLWVARKGTEITQLVVLVELSPLTTYFLEVSISDHFWRCFVFLCALSVNLLFLFITQSIFFVFILLNNTKGTCHKWLIWICNIYPICGHSMFILCSFIYVIFFWLKFPSSL